MGDGAVDLAVSTQVYEYVADIAAALAEARRALRARRAPAGARHRLGLDRLARPDDALMARVLAAWDEHLAHRDLPRRLPELLREAGFALRARPPSSRC